MKKVILILLFIFMNIKSMGELTREEQVANSKHLCEYSGGKWDEVKSNCICREDLIFDPNMGCVHPMPPRFRY